MPEFIARASIEIEVILKAKSKKDALSKLEDLQVSVSLDEYEHEVLDFTVSSDHNPIDWEVSKSEPIE
jgi:hypothetical protein